MFFLLLDLDPQLKDLTLHFTQTVLNNKRRHRYSKKMPCSLFIGQGISDSIFLPKPRSGGKINGKLNG